MTADQPSEANRLFEAALRRDPEERDDYLDKACVGRPLLRAEVAAMLAAHDRDGGSRVPQPQQTRRTGAVMPDTIGHYIIRQVLGQGGMGVVYLAEDTRLSRRVALKALIPDLSRDAARRERLKQEARAAAALTHFGIATVYALEEFGGELYLACEYVAGKTLRTLLKEGPFSGREIVDIATQLAAALAAAHSQGIVHRDLKPENVIRTTAGVMKILDFGLARAESQIPSGLTQVGVLVGTPAYMSPEQVRGEDVDFRTDIFSLGTLLYEAACGRNPFRADGLEPTIRRILDFEPAPLGDVCDCPQELERIVSTCLRKRRDERYRSTHELAVELERLRDSMSSARIQSAGEPAREATRHGDAGPATLRQWWKFHQAAVSITYALSIYSVWHVRRWVMAPWGALLLLSVIAAGVALTTVRLNLLFASRFYAAEFTRQLTRMVPWMRFGDILLALALGTSGVVIEPSHPEFGTLLIALAVAILVAALVIEPATTKAAFDL